jgi:hypothetical protein
MARGGKNVMQFLSADDSSGQVARWCERLHSVERHVQLVQINERQQPVFHSHGWAEGPSETPKTFKIGKEAAQKVLKKYGKGIAGPHSDFDWGFLQGKLSAIRWVLGEE